MRRSCSRSSMSPSNSTRRSSSMASTWAAEGVSEVGSGDRLGDVATSPGADDADDVFGGVGDRDGEEPDRGIGCRDRFDPRPSPAVGHVDVDQHDLWLALADELDGGADLVGVSDDVHAVAELGTDAGAEQEVVVDDEDARPLAHWPVLVMFSSTSVPWPGLLRTMARPPWRIMRPTIDSDTPRRSVSTDPGSKPMPRSRTKTVTRSPSTSTK